MSYAGAMSPVPAPLRLTPPVTTHMRAVEALRRAIQEGRLQPGQRLVEAELCTAFGISRSSVREALRTLVGESLITVIPNRGAQVAVMTREHARELYHAREVLEGEAAALAARGAAPGHLAVMGAALEGFRRAARGTDARGRLDTTAAFYEGLLAAAGNAVIAELLRSLQARVTLLRSRSMAQPGRPRRSLEEMSAILAAIEKGDAEAAREVAIAHVRAASAAAIDTLDP